MEDRWPTAELGVELPYERLGALKRLVHPPEVVLESSEYGANVRAVLIVRADRVAAVEASLAEIGARRFS